MSERRRVRGGAVARDSSFGRARVLEMQRARLLGAAVVVVDELGWSGASVVHITRRARVSRRTFYDLFGHREDCMIAVLHDTVRRVEQELAVANLDGGGVSWVERVRVGLWRILCFLEDDRALARVCVVQSARGSQSVAQAREEILGRLVGVLNEGARASTRTKEVPPLVAEGLVGATVSILHKRLLAPRRASLTVLHGELMSMIVLPYLGQAAAGKERERTAPKPIFRRGSASNAWGAWQQDPLAGLPMRLTHRTARVLEATAQNPGASNRIIGEQSGIRDQGQVSKLLARLEGLGLVENTSGNDHRPTGAPNAWRLTPRGGEIERALRVRPGGSESADNGSDGRERSDKHERTEKPERGVIG